MELIMSEVLHRIIPYQIIILLLVFWIVFFLNLRNLKTFYSKITQKTYLILLIILLLGFVLRLGLYPHYVTGCSSNLLGMEGGRRLLVDGITGFGENGVYPVTIALIYSLFGASYTTVINYFIFVSCLSILLSFFLGYALSKDERVSLYFSGIISLTPFFVFWSGTGDLLVNSMFWVLIATTIIAISSISKNKLMTLFSIISLSLAVQSRVENIVLMVPLIYLMYTHRNYLIRFLKSKSSILIFLIMLILWSFLFAGRELDSMESFNPEFRNNVLLGKIASLGYGYPLDLVPNYFVSPGWIPVNLLQDLTLSKGFGVIQIILFALIGIITFYGMARYRNKKLKLYPLSLFLIYLGFYYSHFVIKWQYYTFPFLFGTFFTAYGLSQLHARLRGSTQYLVVGIILLVSLGLLHMYSMEKWDVHKRDYRQKVVDLEQQTLSADAAAKVIPAECLIISNSCSQTFSSIIPNNIWTLGDTNLDFIEGKIAAGRCTYYFDDIVNHGGISDEDLDAKKIIFRTKFNLEEVDIDSEYSLYRLLLD